MKDTDYIIQLKAALSSKMIECGKHASISYIIEPRLPRTFNMSYSDISIDGFCSFTVSLRNSGSSHTIKVIAHTCDGAKLETLVIKDTSAIEAADKIHEMATRMYEKSICTRNSSVGFRTRLIDLLSGSHNYDTLCNSSHLVVFSSKKKTITVKISLAGTFTADVKHSYKKTGERELTRITGTSNADSADKLAAYLQNDVT